MDKIYGIYIQWNIIQSWKEGNSIIPNNMDEPEWNKPVIKGQIVYDSTYL
jgi:hypothetical protein